MGLEASCLAQATSVVEPAPPATARRSDIPPAEVNVAVAPPTSTADVPGSTPQINTPAAGMNHSLSVQWSGTDDCPAPLERLNELSSASAKHPLTGSVAVSSSAAGWHAQLTLTDTPGAPSAGYAVRHLEGTTCQEVTDAALLVISIMQREREQEQSNAALPAPASSQSPAPAAAPEARVSPLTPQTPVSATPPSVAPARVQADAAGSPSTALGAGASWSLWNTQVPAAGFVLTAVRSGGGWGVRGQVGWSTSVTSLPTSHTARVDLSVYEAALRACWGPFTGLDVCAGPTLERIQVEGRQVTSPIRSASWFPGVSASVLGSQDRAGLGLWGEFGVNVRFREIALDLLPRGRIANIERASLFVWFGPQWRWR
jgi:hypothetical protein